MNISNWRDMNLNDGEVTLNLGFREENESQVNCGGDNHLLVFPSPDQRNELILEIEVLFSSVSWSRLMQLGAMQAAV